MGFQGFQHVQESNNLGVELFEKGQFLGASVAFQQALEQLYGPPSSLSQPQHIKNKTGIHKFIKYHWSKRVSLPPDGDNTEGLFIHQRALYISFNQSTRISREKNNQLFRYGGSRILYNYALCLHMIFLTEACPKTIAQRTFRLYQMVLSAIDDDPALTAAILNNSGQLLTQQGRKQDATYCFKEVARILTIDVTDSLSFEEAHGLYLNTYMIHANTACAA